MAEEAEEVALPAEAEMDDAIADAFADAADADAADADDSDDAAAVLVLRKR